MTLAALMALLRQTLQDPRAGMAAILALRLNGAERFQLLALMALLNVLTAEAFAALLPETPDPSVAGLLGRPFLFFAMQFAGLLILAGLIHGIGRMFGGTGDGAGAQVVVGWLQVVFLVFQVAQVLALLILPPQLTVFIGLASLVAALWLLPHFIAELHGFRSALTTFFGMVFAAVLMTFLMSLVLALFLVPGA